MPITTTKDPRGGARGGAPHLGPPSQCPDHHLSPQGKVSSITGRPLRNRPAASPAVLCCGTGSTRSLRSQGTRRPWLSGKMGMRARSTYFQHVSGGGWVCFISTQSSSQRPPSECFWATRKEATTCGESATLFRKRSQRLRQAALRGGQDGQQSKAFSLFAFERV